MRGSEFSRLAAKAHEAGMAAGNAMVPRAMAVRYQDANGRPAVEVVEDGVCGFAYVSVKPGTGAFAKFMKKELGGFKRYYGGVQISVPYFNQSLGKKEAYAAAYARVLNEAGVNAFSESRID